MKYGQKIKYCEGLNFGEKIIATAYVLKDDGDYIWIAETKDDLKNGIGSTITREDLR